MFNRLLILGAGGHGKVVADIGLKIGYKEIFFLDDKAEGEVLGIKIIGKTKDAISFNDEKTDFVIAIGNNSVRKAISEKLCLPYVSLVHPSAVIGFGTEIGEGTVVMANAAINSGAKIGKHCIINTGAIVEHDNLIEDYVHISPGVVLGGAVKVGSKAHIGIGASVKNNIEICENAVVGAGAVVVKDLKEPAVYAGVPAVKLK